MNLARTSTLCLARLGIALAIGAGCRPQPPPPLHPPPQSSAGTALFRDTAADWGLRYQYAPGGTPPLNIVELMGAGAGFVDFDQDGWLDVLCVGQPHPALFRNEAGKGFRDVSRSSGVDRLTGRWYGCATGDYDDDGRVDLFFTGHNVTALLRNLGGGRFVDVTDAAGVRLRRWCSSAAFADVNHDGRLDLYVACYVNFGPGMPEFKEIQGVPLSLGPDGYDAQKGVLFLGVGGGRFRDATASAGLTDVHGKGLGVAFADADGDGDDDLYIANDQQPQDFMINDGMGRFRNLADERGVSLSSEGDRQGGMGLDWGDYDGDGRLDLFVATFADEPKSLYRAVDDSLYEHAAGQAGIQAVTRPWVAFGTHFCDLDLDGRLDLVVTNGHVQDWIEKADPGSTYRQVSQVFRNLGAGRFEDMSRQAGPDFQRPVVGRALAVGDVDNDGDMDLLIADLEGRPLLLRNDWPRNGAHWLRVRVEGRPGNRQALGARITLEATTGRQIREVRTDGSYLAANDPRVHFGLGEAGVVKRLHVRWPGGGERVLTDLPVDREIVVRFDSPGKR